MRTKMMLIHIATGARVSGPRAFDLPDDQEILDKASDETAWVDYVTGGTGELQDGQKYEADAGARPMPFVKGETVFYDGWKVAGKPTVTALSEIKLRAKAKVNDWRDSEEETFQFLGATIQSTDRSVQRMQSMLELARASNAVNPGSFSIDWRDINNSPITLDEDGMQGMIAALGKHGQAVFTKAQKAKADIEAAPNENIVQAILSGLGRYATDLDLKEY